MGLFLSLYMFDHFPNATNAEFPVSHIVDLSLRSMKIFIWKNGVFLRIILKQAIIFNRVMKGLMVRLAFLNWKYHIKIK